MNNSLEVKTSFYLKNYLENRPMFLATIRVPEAILFKKYIKLIKNPSLDFGCGDGFFAETVFGKSRIDVGLDIKNPRTEKIATAGIYKKIVYYNGQDVPFSDNYFSSIFSNCVLEHISDIGTTIREIYRVLAPGGFFLTSVMTDKWNKYMLGSKIFGKFYIKFMKKKQEHINLFSLKKWINLFRSAGFRVKYNYGYLDNNYSAFLDIAHYLPLPSLISYKLTKKWQPFPKISVILWKKFLERKINTNIDPKKSAALFFILKK